MNDRQLRFTSGLKDDLDFHIMVVLSREEIIEELNAEDIMPRSLKGKAQENWDENDWKFAATKLGNAIWDRWKEV